MTVTGMATPTHLIPVTVDTFDTPTRCQNPKTMTVTWMVTPTRLILATVDTFDMPTRCHNPKTMTVTKMATPTRLIHVTVDTFDTPTRCQNPKTMTVTWMVTPTRLILATVDTLDTLTYQRSQSYYLPYLILPRGAGVADAEIFVAAIHITSQHFQLLRRTCNLFQISKCHYLQCRLPFKKCKCQELRTYKSM